jgi:hypothetical protein
MIAPEIAAVIVKARADAALAERIRGCETFEDLALVAAESGDPVAVHDLRAALAERSAGVLARQLTGRGLIEPLPYTELSGLDAELWRRVQALDLTAPAEQFVLYRGWTAEKAKRVELRYRRFFYLKAALPGDAASPTDEIDEFWHQHIINTRRYGADCNAVAGRFLHHSFLSTADEKKAREIRIVRLTTEICYEKLFGEPYEQTVGAALLARWPSREIRKPAASEIR